MMGRLIDADALMKKFCVNSEGRRIPEVDCDNREITISIKDVKKYIREQPTAYDVERVIAELEAERHPEIFGGWETMRIDRAIEIVRKGGVE